MSRVMIAVVLLVAACGGEDEVSDETTIVATTETASTSTTARATPEATTTTSTATTTTTSEPRFAVEEVEIRVRGELSTVQLGDLYLPVGSTRQVAVVMFGAGRSVVADLARAIAERGVVVLAAEWVAMPVVGADDAVCAVAYAIQHAQEWGFDPQRIVVAGHSAGGLAGMLAALAPEEFTGCDFDAATDVWAYLGLAAAPGAASDGGGLAEQFPDQTEAVELMDAYNYLGNNPDLIVRFVHGVQDTEVPIDQVRAFHAAMQLEGYDTELTEVDNAAHFAPLASGSEAGQEVLAIIDQLVELAS